MRSVRRLFTCAGVSVDLRRKLAIVAGLYFVEGGPMGVFGDVWPVFLRDSGWSLEALGRLSVLGLAWTLKALWAPAVDRYGEWRHWIAGSLVAMAIASAFAPSAPGVASAATLIAIFCLASATQDIAIDASAVALTATGEEGQLSSVRVTMYRVGALAFGSGGLVLADQLGWPVVYQLIAVALALSALAVLASPRVQPTAAGERHTWGASLASWRRPGLLGALGFLAFYRLGDLAMAPMVKLLWRDSGMSLTQIGVIPALAGPLTGILGAALGGLLVARTSLRVALVVGGVLAAASNLVYAAAAWAGAPLAALAGAALAESFCGGAASVALVSLLVLACDRAHAGVQFAALTAISPLMGRLAGVFSGDAVGSFGYGTWFVATAALTLPALLFVPSALRWAKRAR